MIWTTVWPDSVDACPLPYRLSQVLGSWRAASIALMAEPGASRAEKTPQTYLFSFGWPRDPWRSGDHWKIKVTAPWNCHPPATPPEHSHCHHQGLLYLRASLGISWLALVWPWACYERLDLPLTSCLPLSSPHSQGWLCGGRRLDPLQESRRLAPFPQHLPGVVCDCAGGRLVQRRGDGAADVRDPALHLKSLRQWEKGKTAKLLPRGEAFPWKNQSERIHLPYLTSYLLYITMCHIGDMVMWCHFLYIKEIYMHIVGNNT